MRFHALRRIFGEYTREFYPLEKSTPITEPNAAFVFRGARITRRQLKHIIEQRKTDGKSAEEIEILFTEMLETIRNLDFETPNTNQKDHPGSIMRVKIFESSGKGMIVVMDKEHEGVRDVITAFSRSLKHTYLLKKKKLQESASGETPRP